MPHPVLDAFVPEAVREWFVWLAEGSLHPAEHRLEGVVLFADISGFTSLTERLANRDVHGLEELSQILNDFFHPIIETIRDHGGDVLKLAGDSVVACWPAHSHLEQATTRAAACALAIQRNVLTLASTTRLRVRIGLASGEFRVFLLGGEQDRWQLLATGRALFEVGAAEKRANPGEIVLAPGFRERLPAGAQTVNLEDGHARLADGPAVETPVARNPSSFPTSRVTRAVRRDFSSSLPDSTAHWHAELRRVSTLFIHLPGLHPESPASLDLLQSIMMALQKTIFGFGGAINKWTVDDKGISLLAIFGLPPLAHEDDPRRAVLAAQDVIGSFQAIRVDARVAVTTGRAYCGTIGSPNRYEFTSIGAVVNRAARLAQAAPAGEPWCDAATVRGCARRLQFRVLPAVRLRGVTQPVVVHIPTDLAPVVPAPAILFGHVVESGILQAAFQRFLRGERSIVLIEGEAGIGKSTLIQDFLHRTKSAGFVIPAVAGESIHQMAPYHAVRPLLKRVLGLDAIRGAEERAARVLDMIESAQLNPLLMPLVSELLDLGLQDNRITAQILGKIRADNCRWLIADLLRHRVRRQPLAFVIEDLHWLDSASLAVITTMADRVLPILLVASLRPMEVSTIQPSNLGDWFPAGFERLVLSPLPKSECTRLISARIGASDVADDVASFIHGKARGNPLHTLELASVLLDQGALLRRGDRCELRRDADLEALPVPENLEAIITERVDHLDERIQLTAKVASIMGDHFELDLLQAVHPLHEERDRVPEHIRQLVASHLVEPDGSRYRFAHGLIHDAIYGHILRSQRKHLHALIAANLEKTPFHSAATNASLLAHHWCEGGHPEKAGPYLGWAGEHSVRTGAYREAVRYFDKALELNLGNTAVAEPGAIDVRARWLRLRAESLLGLGRLQESLEAFDAAAAALGRSVPDAVSFRDRVRDITQRLAVEPGPSIPVPAVETDRARQRTLCFEALAILNLFANRLVPSFASAHQALVESVSLGASPELARALATISLALSLVPIRHLAESYADRAIRMATELHEESTQARVMELVALWLLGDAQWERCGGLLQAAIRAFEQVGDTRRRIECTCLYSTFAHYRGRFEERVVLGRRVSELGEVSGDLQALAWGQLDQLESLISLGKLEAARAFEQPLLRQIGTSIVGGDIIMAQGLLAALHLKLGHMPRAIELAASALPLIVESAPTVVYNLEAYAGIAETFLAEWGQEAPVPSPEAAVARRALAACAALRRFSKVFKIGRPRAFVALSRAAELSGRPSEARSLAERALVAAEQAGMPAEEARATARLAELLPLTDPRRARLVSRASVTCRASD